jgi:hypothetical protein
MRIRLCSGNHPREGGNVAREGGIVQRKSRQAVPARIACHARLARGASRTRAGAGVGPTGEEPALARHAACSREPRVRRCRTSLRLGLGLRCISAQSRMFLLCSNAGERRWQAKSSQCGGSEVRIILAASSIADF